MIRKTVPLLTMSLMLFTLVIQAQPSGRVITPEDVMSLVKIRNVSLSPDGERVLYMTRNDIWIADATDPEEVPYQIGIGAFPQWTENGKAVYYLKSGDTSAEILRYRFLLVPFFDGWMNTDVVVKISAPVRRFALSPDGNEFALLIPEVESPADPAVRVKSTENPNLPRNHLWLFNNTNQTLRRLTDGPFTVTSFDWAPDGSAIVFAAQPGPETRDELNSSIYMVHTESFEITPLVTDAADLPAWSPQWARQGGFIYYLTLGTYKDYWLGALQLATLNLATGRKRLYPETIRHRVTRVYHDNPDSTVIYYLVEEGVTYQLYGLPLNTGVPFKVTGGHHIWEDFSFSRDMTKTAFVREDSSSPPELYISPFPRLNPQRRTNLNAQLWELPETPTEIIRWKNKNGQEIEGILVRPLNFDPGKKYPFILYIHGGPASCFSNRFFIGRWCYPPPLFSAHGFWMLMPNPRGSTGYGNQFKLALRRNWGIVDYEDLMAGVDHVIANYEGVDPDRLGVAGWSYGGYMTASVITQTHRFKAASIGAGFANLTSMFGTTDVDDWLISYFGTTPYSDPELYQRFSPLLQMKTAVTPTLIQHGDRDYRVPLSQADEMYRALKTAGVPTELAVYPGEAHILTNAGSVKDSLERNLNWFKKYLQPPATAEPVSQ